MSSRRLTTPDLVVLAILCERPMHGYELSQELVDREVRDWAGVSRAQVYYSLRKLSQAGYIRATDSEGSGGPERTVYRMGASGLTAMGKALDSLTWATQRPPNPFITWLALSVHLPRSAVKRVIQARTRYVQKQLEKERATLAELEDAQGAMVAVGRAMVSLGISQFETELAWLGTLARELAREI